MTERLLVFAPNWLGDAVMALPAIAQIARRMPAGAIDIAARASVAPLFTMVDAVKRTIVLNRHPGDADDVRAGGYDTALLLPNSFNVARLARSAGIHERWGYRGDFRSLLLTRAVSPPMRLHQTEYYRHLVEALGFDAAKDDPGPAGAGHDDETDVPKLRVSDEQRASGSATLMRAGWDGRAPLVAMAPGAAFGGAKRWPAASFAGLASSLSSDGVRAVLIGSAGDAPGVSDVLSSVRATLPPINLVGRTDLSALAGVLLQCRALVTNDSGAMHFAAALGVNVTAMFGPTRERDTHPRGSGRHTVLTNPTWCRPCMLRECPLTQRCMTGITVDAVRTATRPFLA